MELTRRERAIQLLSEVYDDDNLVCDDREIDAVEKALEDAYYRGLKAAAMKDFDTALKAARSWKHHWMNKEMGYFDRAFNIDSNMIHSLAHRICDAFDIKSDDASQAKDQ